MTSPSWNGAAVLRSDGSLVVTDARLGNPTVVDKPGEGAWMPVGGPVVPTNSPPVITGADGFLVMLADEPDKGALSAGDLIVVDAAGVTRTIFQLSQGSHLATWSRGHDRVVVLDDSGLALIFLDDGSVSPLGPLVPNSFYVLTAG